jgi:hypothetical protein
VKKYSQTPATPATPTTVPTAVPAKIDIRSIPNFKSTLFQVRPDIISDIENIVNIINKYLVMLSTPPGSITFNMVWTNPSISGSQSANSVKNLLNLAKWIYTVIKAQSVPYTIDGLRAIGTGLITTVKSYSFPEPNASTIQSELMIAGQAIINKLGPNVK